MRASPIMLAAAVLALLPLTSPQADPGHHGRHPAETAYGRPGDPTKGGRVIQVAMRETQDGMAFAPEKIEVARGEQVQFLLRNNGELDHELVIGTVEANRAHADEMANHPDMAHDDPNARRLRPRMSGVLRWQFTEAGIFEYACLIPGHREAGMVGTILVR